MRPISEDEAADYRREDLENRERARLERMGRRGGPDAPEECEECDGEGEIVTLHEADVEIPFGQVISPSPCRVPPLSRNGRAAMMSPSMQKATP